MSWAIRLLPLWAFRACSRANFAFDWRQLPTSQKTLKAPQPSLPQFYIHTTHTAPRSSVIIITNVIPFELDIKSRNSIPDRDRFFSAKSWPSPGLTVSLVQTVTTGLSSPRVNQSSNTPDYWHNLVPKVRTHDPEPPLPTSLNCVVLNLAKIQTLPVSTAGSHQVSRITVKGKGKVRPRRGVEV
jgi:hypothetical protein